MPHIILTYISYLQQINQTYHLSKNYNNEPVFFTTWNLQSHIYLLTSKKILAWPISHRIISNKNYYPSHNINNFEEIIKDKKFLYIEYGEDGSPKFDKIKNYENLKLTFEELKKRKIKGTSALNNFDKTVLDRGYNATILSRALLYEMSLKSKNLKVFKIKTKNF